MFNFRKPSKKIQPETLKSIDNTTVIKKSDLADKKQTGGLQKNFSQVNFSSIAEKQQKELQQNNPFKNIGNSIANNQPLQKAVSSPPDSKEVSTRVK